ncbi:DUF262 domain-containing protein [Telmatocola sphagniphila]|uniref:DUF262 domain-containing protein n=1 Tax=Telmatocola sphagniphila TaxID=1123043 RepID=A0A8E6ESI2_9BACT|nr:DUF262 domain-containing protein [Telmatocola sphagniphila]QVL30784.1 DUF262 domain-containing protein [Telmatocola sphagniphila]
MPTIDPVSLIAAADEQVAKVRTQGKDYSFNELLSMHEEGELIINPEYQRLFRWPEEKESRFIESLILELPLPPIFVIEVEGGRYELIDGLQRISSYFHYRGKLKAPHRSIKVNDYLKLIDCDIVEALNGHVYDDLPEALRIKLKRHSVRVEVIRKESDRRLRYHMFKRLNTGGALLSEQEIRNCTIRLLDNTFNQFIIDCSQEADFIECTSNVGSEQIDKKFDQELALRFFAFKNWPDKYSHEIGSFLTEYMEAVTDPLKGVPFDYTSERLKFKKTFGVLRACLGSDAFYMVVKRSTGTQSKYPFSVLHYEAFTLGLQSHLERLDLTNSSQIEKMKSEATKIKYDEEFIKLTTGGGKNTKGSLTKRIQFVSDRIGKVI